MADVVQYRLERMIEHLDDLEQRGIFTRREIAEIVKKRRNFEFRLKRPSPLKQDFLAYIEYEKHLDKLRRLRKKSVTQELKEDGDDKKTKTKTKKKRSASDVAGVMGIIEIYRKAVMRFKGDLDLWFRYLEYCREKRHGRMNKVLAQVIRLHPKVPGIWLYAAAWEFDQNLNVVAARSLMQNGLRACPESEDIWVEYLRMELTYINKLKARKAALGEDTGTLARDNADADEKQWRDENKDLFMPLDDKSKEDDQSDEKEDESEKKVDVFREQGSILLKTIYSGAVEALPSSMSLRKRFLDILDETDLAHSEELREEIMNGMKRDFADKPEYWDWLARLQIVNLKKRTSMSKEDMLFQLNKAVEVYEEALESVPSAKMFSFYTKFWMDAIAPETEDSQIFGFTSTSDNVLEFTSHLLKVFEKADSMGYITEDLAYNYISVYLQLGRLEEARKLAEKFCNEKLNTAVKIWVIRASIEMKCVTKKSTSPSKDDFSAVFKLLQNVLTKVAISDAESLWLMAIKFFSNQADYFSKLVETFMVFLARHAEGVCSLSTAIVNSVLQRDGIQHAREVYKRLLLLPHPSLALHRNCIELESNLAYVGDKDGLANARKLYESALTTYSHDVALWRDYYSMEIKVGTSETANAVHWRARKTLKDAAVLISPLNL